MNTLRFEILCALLQPNLPAPSRRDLISLLRLLNAANKS